MMSDTLKTIVEDGIKELESSLDKDQLNQVAKILESAVIRGMLEGQHRAVDTCKDVSEAEQDTAHKIATAIRQKNDVLITNLSSLR